MLAADDKQRPLEYGDDEPGVEDALELHYDSDSDDEAATEQECNSHRLKPTDTTDPATRPTKLD